MSSSLVRLVEPSFPFLQPVPGLPHALCLLLHGVGGICRLEEGTNCAREMRKPVTEIWHLLFTDVSICLSFL